MITQYGKDSFDVDCDFCGFSQEYETDSWSELMDLMKEEGWRNSKAKGEWEHHCPACSGPEKAFAK